MKDFNYFVGAEVRKECNGAGLESQYRKGDYKGIAYAMTLMAGEIRVVRRGSEESQFSITY